VNIKTVQLVEPHEDRPDPEVPEKAKRRTFSAAYKCSILEKADRCTEPGEIGSLLRREGLYSSHLSQWRRQRENGALAGLSPQKRGPRKQPTNPLAHRVEAQQREITKLQKKLEQAEIIIDFQKKTSELLGISLEISKNGEKH